jgi:hypothetical protein
VFWRWRTIAVNPDFGEHGSDGRCSSQATVVKAFPARPLNWFWTSTPYAGDASLAWVVNFNYGGVGNGYRSDSGQVRLVR